MHLHILSMRYEIYLHTNLLERSIALFPGSPSEMARRSAHLKGVLGQAFLLVCLHNVIVCVTNWQRVC